MDLHNSFLRTTPIAHRGLHGGDIPENSFAAFEAAIKEGYAIEMDVRFTKDYKLVVFHDDEIDRLTDGSGFVKNYTYEELKKFSLKNGEHIRLFSDFLKFVDGRTPILIELKHMPHVKGLPEATVEQLKGYTGEYAFQSFNPLYIKRCRKLCPDKPIGQLASWGELADFKYCPTLWRTKARIMRRMWTNFITKPDFVSYRYDYLPMRCTTRFRKKANKVLLAWCIRTKEQLEKMSGLVDNVIFENVRPEIHNDAVEVKQ